MLDYFELVRPEALTDAELRALLDGPAPPPPPAWLAEPDR